jgi:hypothetical protein
VPCRRKLSVWTLCTVRSLTLNVWYVAKSPNLVWPSTLSLRTLDLKPMGNISDMTPNSKGAHIVNLKYACISVASTSIKLSVRSLKWPLLNGDSPVAPRYASRIPHQRINIYNIYTPNAMQTRSKERTYRVFARNLHSVCTVLASSHTMPSPETCQGAD